ncbi:hypothetical protein HDU88_004771 [Geranomyces variabilis]|nr:hypothetical protein HDU88_004771 [Geranomyces variabilis]
MRTSFLLTDIQEQPPTKNIRELDPTDFIILKDNERLRWTVPSHVRKTRHLRGAEAEVVAVVDSTGKRAAKKAYFVVPRTPKGEPTINIEIQIYQVLKNVPYTMDFLGCVQRNGKAGPTIESYLSPWCDNSLPDLMGPGNERESRVEWFANLSGEHQWQRICIILLQVSRALSLFHALEQPLIHYDINPENILLHPETHSIIYIGFGVARICSDGTTAYAPGGTKTYPSPEFLDDAVTNRKSDVFSLGCVIIELLAKSTGKNVARFRKYRKEDRIMIDGKWVRNPSVKDVRFSGDPDIRRDDSFARHAETVAAYVDHIRKPGVLEKLYDIATSCISHEPRNRLSAFGLHMELRKALLPEIDEDARREFTPLEMSPASSNSSLVVRPGLADSSEDEDQDLRKFIKQVTL